MTPPASRTIDRATERILLQRFPALAGIAAQRRESLLAHCALRKAPEGAVLFEPGMPCTGFPLVIEGSVRVAMRAPSGREILLYRVEPGESCILSGGCLLGHADYSASGIAESGVTLLLVPPALFQELIVHEEGFRTLVFSAYGARLAEVMELVEAVAFQRVDERLARLLIHRGPLISASHQALADELGSAREVISRLLGSFASRGWVKLERERVTVTDPKSLAALAAG